MESEEQNKIKTIGSDITPEAIGFLSAVGVFIVALALLFLFINKKLCFSEVGGLPCLEPRGRRRKPRTGIKQGLVKSFGNDQEDDDDGSSSTGSEAEILKQFEISVSRSQSFRNSAANAEAHPPPQSQSQRSLNQRHRFTRLSDHEEGSTEPSDMEDSAQTQDPLSAVELAQTRTSSRSGVQSKKSSQGSTAEEQTSLNQSSVDRTSVSRISVDKTSVDRTSVDQTSTDHTSVDRTSVGQTSVGHSSVDRACTDRTSASQSSTGRTSVGRTSAGRTSAGRTSAGRTSADRTSADRTSAGRTSADRTSIDTTSAYRSSPTLSAVRQEADGSEDTEAQTAVDRENATDSSSTCSPEQEHPPTDAEPSDLSSSPRFPVSKCADLVLTLEYCPDSERVLVSVVEARDVPDKARSGMDSWQVHMVLLPAKKQRHKTTVQRGSAPQFNETFRFSRVEPSDLHTAALRFRLYALGGRMSRERMMGEKVLRLSALNPEGGRTETTLLLEPRCNIKSMGSQVSLTAVGQSDSASSTQSLTHGGVPELLVGLSYNATTGRMSVELIKGSHFRNLALNRPPDTFGRLSLLNSVGQEISRCKTSVRRGQPNPVYKETFVFQVALFQLSDVTLLVSIFNRRSMKRKEMVGWIALGQNSSGEEEQLHWQDMRDGKGQQVCRWHVLLEG